MNTEQDIKYAVAWNQFIMSVLGIWPDPSTEEHAFSRYRFMIPVILMSSLLGAPQTVNLVKIWGDVDLMTENLMLANIPVMNASMKVLITRYYREALKPLIGHFMEDWQGCDSESKRSTMLKSAAIGRRISIGCTLFSQATLTVFLVYRMLTIIRTDRKEVRPDHALPYSANYPFDTRNSPAFEILLCGQIVSAFCAATSYSAIDTFISMLVLHVCGQFAYLRTTLEELFDNGVHSKSQEEFSEELSWIVKRHKHLIWYAKTIDGCFNELLFAQMMFCTIELCFQGFQFFKMLQALEDLPFLNSLFLISYTTFIGLHLYLYCYVGEMLLVQNSKLSLSAYSSKWYNASAKQAENLILIMLQSTMPLRLTAGKFGTFSLEMFSTIIKTALGYLSVLLTVTSHTD